MAVRPVFVVSLDNQYCIRENIEFECLKPVFITGFISIPYIYMRN